MFGKRILYAAFIAVLGVLILFSVAAAQDSELTQLTPIEELGKAIFFDNNLSVNNNESCATCHNPDVGFTGPSSDTNAAGAVYEGSVLGSFGNRKPPSAAYATTSPVLHFVIEKKDVLFIGGNFWDGRATGEKLGNPAADQAQGPFLNPLEQALTEASYVVTRVCDASYGDLFRNVWGPEACDSANVAMAYDEIALSIAAYEASHEVNAFSSKYDCYLAGKVDLTKEEKKGMNMFNSTGKCSACHILDPGPNGEPPLFTDYTYDNLGVPRNPENPFYNELAWNPDGYDWVDAGLGGYLDSRGDYEEFAEENLGKQKVPTLRNVGLGSCEAEPENPGCIVKAYMHNGYFKSLKDVVHFYSTRDSKPTCSDPFTTAEDALVQGCWPEPEVAENVNTSELGKLNLTEAQEDEIVDFMLTLSDGYMCSE